MRPNGVISLLRAVLQGAGLPGELYSSRSLLSLQQHARTHNLQLSDGRTAKVIVIDSTQQNHSSIHQGVAFWVEHRLVGNPSWVIGQVANFDGRTRFAKRYKVIVDPQGFEDQVIQDWTGFLRPFAPMI